MRNQLGSFAFTIAAIATATTAKLMMKNTQYAWKTLRPVCMASHFTEGEYLNAAFSPSPAACLDASANSLPRGCSRSDCPCVARGSGAACTVAPLGLGWVRWGGELCDTINEAQPTSTAIVNFSILRSIFIADLPETVPWRQD